MKNRINRPAGLVINILVILFSISCIFPVFWLFYSSLKTETEFSLDQIALPSALQFDNYIKALRQANFGTYLWNSLFNSLLTLAAVLVLYLFCYKNIMKGMMAGAVKG